MVTIRRLAATIGLVCVGLLAVELMRGRIDLVDAAVRSVVVLIVVACVSLLGPRLIAGFARTL